MDKHLNSTRHSRKLNSKEITFYRQRNKEGIAEFRFNDLVNLKEIIDLELQLLNEKERIVLIGRLGFHLTEHQKATTLEEIGHQLGISRERVRQIEFKANSKINCNLFFTKKLAIRLERILHVNHPIAIQDLFEDDPWFKGSSVTALSYVLHHHLNQRFHLIEIDQKHYLSSFSEKDWKNHFDALQNKMKEASESQSSIKQLQIDIQHHLINELHFSPSMVSLMWSELMKDAHLMSTSKHQKNSEDLIIGYGHQYTEYIKVALIEAGKPLHHTEILSAIKKRYPNIELNAIYHKNILNKSFIFYGKGHYGLINSCNLNQDQIDLLTNKILFVLKTKPIDYQWFGVDLLKSVKLSLSKEEWITLPEIDLYHLNAVISSSDKVINLGRFVYQLKDKDNTVKQTRITIHEAIVETLKEYGKPMGIEEIKEVLQKKRGLNPHFQIVEKSPLVKQSNNLWSLAS